MPGSIRNRRAEQFGLEGQAVLETTTLPGGGIGVARVRYDDHDLPSHSAADVENAFAVYLHLRPLRSEMEIDGKSGLYAVAAGGVSLIDQRLPSDGRIFDPFDQIAFHLPHAVIEAVEADRQGQRVGEIRHSAFDPLADPVIRGLAQALIPALEKPAEANALFIDHVGWALAAHVGHQYVAFERRGATARLSPLDLQRVKDMIEARLDGGISLADLAAACDVSVGHFARAFRRTLGLTPHRWLLQRRVDHARTLLGNRDIPIAEVAMLCGFADQSHLTRVFAAQTGQSPGRWRRDHARRM